MLSTKTGPDTQSKEGLKLWQDFQAHNLHKSFRPHLTETEHVDKIGSIQSYMLSSEGKLLISIIKHYPCPTFGCNICNALKFFLCQEYT